jgi:hypothetical protein
MQNRLTVAFSATMLVQSALAAVPVVELPSPMPGTPCRAPVGSAINESGAVIANCGVLGGASSSSFVWSPQLATWTPIIVGPPGSSTRAIQLNNLGQVAGYTCSLGCQGFLWTPGQPTFLSPSFSIPFGLNDLGQMVLSSPNRIRYPDGAETALPAGWEPAVVNALNNLAQVAVRNTSTNEWGVWTSAAGISALPVPPSGYPVGAILYSINDTGRLVGASAGDPSTQRTIFYAPTTGYQLLPQYTFPSHVSALGHLSGESLVDVVNNVYSATFIRMPDEIIDLGLYGGARTVAVASNSSSQVVGFSAGQILLWTVPPPPPPPPAQQIAQVVSTLTALVESGTLSRQDTAGLHSKLGAANLALSKSDQLAAKNLLQATINQIAALEKSRRLDGATSGALRASIDSVIAAL